ncbi:hypothetical protein BGZ76_004687 [Entomortierella beljakovae]|nr:hypothetical protein BGZ76_004687 [Entomortierella beljakovae]
MLDEMCSPQHYFLPSLLKHCPELEEISIPYYDGGCREISEILKTHCPKLRALNQGVYISPFYEFTISQLLANAFPNGIQRLILGKVLKPSQNRQHRLLHVLANSPSVNTLEILEMKYSPADIGGDVLRILQLCPKLKELRLSADSQTLAAAADISDLVSTPSVPWKCQDSLQVLELDVSNQKEELLYKKNKIRSVLQQRTAQLVKELFRKLQSIHNLRILNLNWKSSSFQSDAMPLEIGLAYINDAWSETESTIVNMTKSDLTWIGLNWKTLDEIRQVKEMKKMKQAAARCRTDFIKNNLSNDRERISIYQDEELDQDWSLSTNQKRSGKSRIMCNRKTMKNNLAWIQKRS